MITSKEELKEYIDADKKALGCLNTSLFCLGKEVLKFEIALRKVEFYDYKVTHKGNILDSFFYCVWRIYFHQLSVKCGFDICINTFEKGLNIHHRGTIVVHKNARIGENCDILPGVVIGQNGTIEDVPNIGSNVYIGTGAKVIGKIHIDDNIVIGANSVVNKSFYNTTGEKITIAGVPAKVIGKGKVMY